MIRCKGLLSLYALTCFRLYIDPYYSVLLRQNYGKYRRLNAFFRIVSTSKDRNGVEFISTMEGKHKKYKES